MTTADTTSDDTAKITDPSLSKADSSAEGDETDEDRFAELVGSDGTVAILPVRGTLLFPNSVNHLVVSRPTNATLIRHIMTDNRVCAVFLQKDPDREDPSVEDLHEVGTLATVIRFQQSPDGVVHVLLHGHARVRIREVASVESFMRAVVSRQAVSEEPGVHSEALIHTALQQLERLLAFAPEIPAEALAVARTLKRPGKMADFLASFLPLEPEEAQSLLAEPRGEQRLGTVVEKLERRLHVLALGKEIHEAAKESINERQTEVILREQLEAIQARLGEDDESQRGLVQLKEQLAALGLPDEAQKEVDREIARLGRTPSQSPEYNIVLTYLEWMADLPWSMQTDDQLDLSRARQVLDEDHYGLDEIKERILEHLAVLRFRGDAKAPILCFVGPPGTGKTSLGRSIARALGRQFVGQSLGGVHDEAAIRGHRRTYIGAMPGKILQALRRAGSKNPVMMLDEIDKVGGDFRGDPYSALLEVLDPAQNSAFVDHYINVPFDLSKVMFICTANVLDTLPAPLRDRMEVIVLSGYTPHEKLQIAQLHLVPRALDDLGLQSEHIRFDDTALEFIIAGYTRDAGTRSLERAIRSILRKVARKLAESDGDAAAFGTIDRDRVRALLGHPQHPEETAIDLDEPGSALGLAWTPAGGELLVIEAAAVPGGRGLTLTGQLGDVMKESAAAALTWVRAHVDQLGADRQRLEQSEVHLHVPAGAIPKDGPSAGVAMCAALVSLFTGRMPKPRVAMTGEITLRGRVLPIGGVKLKVLGAHRLGIRTVILPKGNEHDLEEIPEDARNGLDFVLVEKIADVLDAAMEPQKVDQSAA